MGFSAPTDAPVTDERGLDGLPPAKENPNFGERLGTYAKERFPIAGGLAEQVFGGGAPTPAQVQPNSAQNQPDYADMIAMNAKPPAKEGGGLEMLLKLFGG